MKRDKADAMLAREQAEAQRRLDDYHYEPLCVRARRNLAALRKRQAHEARVREQDEPHRARAERADIQAERTEGRERDRQAHIGPLVR